MSNANIIGPAKNRVDGPLKVTGKAKYAVEFEVAKCAYVWPVISNIAKGKITAIDLSAAQSAPGVLKIFTHQNALKPKPADAKDGGNMVRGIRIETRDPLSDDQVHYAGQIVALAVAETLEQARFAASLVRLSYAPEKPLLTMDSAGDRARKPEKLRGEAIQLNKGDVEAAFSDASLIKIEQTYTTPTETHNPIEMSGTIADWEGEDKLTVWDATQFVKGVQSILARIYGLKPESVRVVDPFVGGAFGCKGPVWPHTLLATMAAKELRRPVKLHLSRREMFTGSGHRTPTRQTIALAAGRDGKLRAMRHVTETRTSMVGDWTEACGARSTGVMYSSPAIRIEETVFPVNISTRTSCARPVNVPARRRWR
jgi:xanthine dehydrogenase YagR molybdenum-binding subunit